MQRLEHPLFEATPPSGGTSAIEEAEHAEPFLAAPLPIHASISKTYGKKGSSLLVRHHDEEAS